MEASNACALQRFFFGNHVLKIYTITKVILIDAPTESVFSALTNSVKIPLFYPLIKSIGWINTLLIWLIYYKNPSTGNRQAVINARSIALHLM